MLFGAHTIEAEFVLVSSIEPRLYLMTRMIMDVSHPISAGVFANVRIEDH